MGIIYMTDSGNTGCGHVNHTELVRIRFINDLLLW
jgi:hypothetical protein